MEVPEARKIIEVKYLIEKLETQWPLNYTTLKYLIKFCSDVVSYEEHNRMGVYNVSITVAPNIFRPENEDPDEL